MNKLSQNVLALLAALTLSGPAFSKSVEVVEPQIIGLYFHASWCASCKTLDPEVQAAAEDLKKLPYLLVTLDVSNKSTQHQAGMTAAAIGLADIYQATGLKTGFIILVNAQSGEEVGRITKEDNAAAIASRIKALTVS